METASYYYSDKEHNADRVCLFYLQNYPYNKRDISWHMDLIPQKVYSLKIKAADLNAAYIETLSGKAYNGRDLNAGIQVRADKSGECGKIFLFEKMNR